MKYDHIIERLDREGLAALAPHEAEAFAAHSEGCADCAAALRAARAARFLVGSRVEVGDVAPPPFFETRVLAALREKQVLKTPYWSFRRWWQASSGLVSAMVLMAAVFAVLTIFAPKDGPQDVTNFNLYSTEAEVLNQRSAREMTREQMLEVIYGERREQGRK